MSLTLRPVNSNFFLRPVESVEAIMEARVRSLDNVNKNNLKEQLTGRWLQDCENHMKTPFVKRLNAGGSAAQLGTTFPPRGHMYPLGETKLFGRRDTFHSEPDLSPLAAYSDDDESLSLGGEEDEDHLFEFDLAPEQHLDHDHLDPDITDSRLTGSGAQQPPLLVVSQNSPVINNGDTNNCDTLFSVAGDRQRTYSNSSSGSCSHRKPLNKLPEGEEGSGAVYRAGFSSLFGSTSSGLGSERRTSQETLIFGDEENKSFEPAEWRDYMNERLSSSEGTVTPLSCSAPDLSSVVSGNSAASSLAASVDGSGSGTGTPPITAVSPCPPPMVSAAESPLISPDSLLEGQTLEESYVPSSPPTSCPECDRNSLELANLSLQDKTQKEKQEDVVDSNQNLSTTPSINPSDEDDKPEVSTPPDKADNAPKIREEDLTQLLTELEEDNHVYPGLRHVNSANSTLSEQEIGEDITPLRKASAPARLANESPEPETPKLRKCSSLKSGKTPPGSPGQRKYVRFADIFGLDLSEVKTFVDEIPKVPRSAFKDLDVDMNDFDVGSPMVKAPVFQFKPQNSPKKGKNAVSQSCLVPMFTQPGCSSTFLDQVNINKVSLENAFMEAPFVLSGIVRVLNIDFNKAVMVRWTVNDWHSHNDTQGTYVSGSSDGNTDKFSFRIQVGVLPVGSRVQFCVQYVCSGREYWDSNQGTNYVFQVFLNTNSPGGGGGAIRGTSPPNSRNSPSRGSGSPYQSASKPIPAPAQSYTSPAYQTYTPSPSIHGDDPWMRFM